MTSKSPFSIDDFETTRKRFVSKLITAQLEITDWYSSDTATFFNDVGRDVRTVIDHPERAGANVRAFFAANPEYPTVMASTVVTVLRMMAFKPSDEDASRQRHPAGKGRGKARKATLSVVDNEGTTHSSTVTMHEAIVDGYQPTAADTTVLNHIGALADDTSKSIRRRGASGTTTPDDDILWAYMEDLRDNIERGDVFATRTLVRVMTASTAQKVRDWAALAEQAMGEVGAPQGGQQTPDEPVQMMMQQLTIVLPEVTYEGRKCALVINESDREAVVEALREAVDEELKVARKAVDDYPTEGDMTAVRYLMDVEGSLRNPSSLYATVDLIDHMGQSASSLAHQSSKRLLELLSGWDS